MTRRGERTTGAARTRGGGSAPAGPGIRLQRVLADAGIGSRRACEALIAEGRVEVDGRVVEVQGMRVVPETAVIRVDGARIATSPTKVYLAFNKPRGVVSTMSDPEGRPSLSDYVGDRSQRLFHVGRLDVDTEGLLLLTNDGDLAHRLSHPSYEVPKTYLAEVVGPVPRDLGRTLRRGVELEDGVVRADDFRVVQATAGAGRVLVEIVLHEGRKHVVRRLMDAVGHPVKALVRLKVGPVALGSLKPGRARPLNRKELADLFAAVGL